LVILYAKYKKIDEKLEEKQQRKHNGCSKNIARNI